MAALPHTIRITIEATGPLARWLDRQNELSEQILLDIRDYLYSLNQGQQDMAKNIQDIGSGVTGLRTAIAEEREEVKGILEEQGNSIAELKELVAAGGTQEQIESVLADIESARTEVTGIYEKPMPEPTDEGEGGGGTPEGEPTP